MKLQQILNVVPFVAVLVVLLGLFTVDPVSPETNPTALAPSDNSNVQTEKVEELPVAGEAGFSAISEPADSPAATSQDGAKLLQIYCSECHSVGLLVRSERPRDAWEQILLRMEKSGVHLNESEKTTLLDHLTGRDEP